MKLAQKKSHAPLFLILGALPAVLLAVSQTPASLWALETLTALLALIVASVAGMRLALGAGNATVRGVWQAVIALAVLVAIAELGGPSTETLERRLGFEGVGGWAMLIAALAIVLLATRLDQVPAWSRLALWAGVLAHLLAIALDSGGTSASTAELVQFVALQLYLLGVVTFVASLRRLSFTLQLSPMVVGDMARSMFSNHAMVDKYRYPRTWAIRLPGGKTVLAVARFFICFIDCAPVVRKKFGLDYWTQLKGICRVAFRHGLDARAYYLFELYRPEQMRRAAGYLTRYETKNGLFKILTSQLPKRQRPPSLGNKLTVHELCERNNIPTPPLLGIAKAGGVELLCDPQSGLDQDLFVKLVKAKGSRGAERFQRIGPNRYRDHAGVDLSLDQLLERLARRSKSGALLIQSHIANHPDIAEYARESLITIRVITCLDESRQPVITHGFLRVVSKLEADWPHKIELGSKIDLETGVLDLMTGDKEKTRFEWYRDHPVTGAPILGRILPYWDEVKAVALAAHRASAERLFVGWDIAVSPTGPLLLEGNAYADVDFLQRVHRCPIGDSPLGPLLYARLIDLQHRIDSGTVRHMKDYD